MDYLHFKKKMFIIEAIISEKSMFIREKNGKEKQWKKIPFNMNTVQWTSIYAKDPTKNANNILVTEFSRKFNKLLRGSFSQFSWKARERKNGMCIWISYRIAPIEFIESNGLAGHAKKVNYNHFGPVVCMWNA